MKKALIALLAVVGCLHPLYSQQEARQLFFEGENRFNNRSYEAALDRYTELVETYPDSPFVADAQFRRALSLYHLGSYEEAIVLFDRVERRFRSTQFLDALPFWKGLALYRDGSLDDASEELTRQIASAEAGPRTAQAYLYRGIIRSRRGMPEEAAEDLDAAASSGEAEIAGYARALWGELLYGREEFPELVTRFEEERWSIEEFGEWGSELFFYIGDAYLELQRPEEAEEILRRIDVSAASTDLAAATLQRRFAVARRSGEDVRPLLQEAEERLAGEVAVLQRFWLQVGEEQYESGSRDLAEFYFRRVWDLRGRTRISGAAPLYLSRILVGEGANEDAMEILEEARQARLEPTGEIALALAGLYSDAGRFEDAEQLLQRLLDGATARESEVRYRLAFVLYQQGRVNETLDLIDDTLSAGIGGDQTAQLLRLRSRSLRDLQRYRESLQAIREYLALAPDDEQARFEYLTLLFRLDEYQRLLEELDAREAGISTSDAAYLRGLAQVGLGRYEEAISTLEGVAGTGSLEPYRRFYLAWSYYRSGRNRDALELFDDISGDRNSPFAPRSAYLGGWSAFALGSYDRATQLLRRVPSFDASMELNEDAWRLLAETHRAAGEDQEALSVYRTIMAEARRPEVIAEAWLSYALLLANLDREEEALDSLSSLNEQFPSTAQGERALYEAGRLLEAEGSYEAARQRFQSYRRRYPEGAWADAALYREGRSLVAQGQSAGALLVWERFLEEHGDSPLVYEVKRSLAPLYEERGELRRAFNLLGELVAAYPDRAGQDGLEQQRQEISLRLQGLPDREASLWARVEGPETGTESRRDAILELGRILAYEGGVAGPRQELLVGYLRELADEGVSSSPRARFLLGEWFASEERYDEAIEAFLATADEATADLTARALFRTAQMYGAQGDRAAVRTVVSRIEEEFPDSPWAAEARRLLGGSNR
ncbi:MAG: tetratricopeptide repeat protein [Alkalispirochaetaceae bacterium]